MPAEAHGFLWDFLTSAGFGGTAALAAAGIAYRGIRQRIGFEAGENERARVAAADLARDSDARQRWWDAVQWTWENQAVIDSAAMRDLIAGLSPLAKTATQVAFLKAVKDAIYAPRPEEPQR